MQLVWRQPMIVADRLDQKQEHLGTGMWIDARLRFRTVENLHAIDLFGPRHGRAPDRQSGEVGAGDMVESELANNRVNAIATDDEVIGRPLSIGELDLHGVVALT